MQNPVLAFSTMYYVEELQSQFKGLKINSKFDGLLLSAFLESQLIISIELYVAIGQFAQIVQEMSSEAIIQLITRYDNFYDAVDGDDDRNYANSISCTMLVQTVSVFGSKAVGRSMEKFVEEKGVKAIKTWLMKPLDYDSQISTEFLELDLVDAFELLIPKSRVAEFERILIEFFDREWERSLSRCSGSYVDMMRVHDELVDLGYPDIQFVSPSKQVFSDSLVSKWSCFVSTYLQDEDLNDLHLTVSGFLNDQWALGYQDFTQAHISQETWLELLELELNLLRLTNRVSTSEFSTVAGIACAMTVDTWNSDELLNSANEIWQYLQVGKEMSEELGIWDYEYRVQSFVNEVLFMILPDDLNCDDLDELFEMVVKILGILVESELNDEVADCLLLMQEIVEVKGEGDCSGDGRNYDARRQRHKAILDAIETLNLSYPITKQLKDAYQLGMIEIGLFDYPIELEFLDFRLKHKGSLCELDVLSLLDAIKVLQTVYKPFDKNAELEFYSINELYWLVSDLAVEYLTGDKESQCEILEASQMLLNEIRRIMKFGADRENRAQAAYRYASALQEFYHKTGQREEGADFIVQAGLEALKLMDNDWQIQQLNYLLCEELSCSGEFDEAIFFRSLCLLDTSETWEQEDLWQFAQDQFIDEILSGNSAASNFEELWTAPELEDYDIAQTQCLVEQHNGYHQITIVDFPEGAFPLIEISKSTLEHETAMILKVEGKGYKIAELGAEFEFIGNRTDSLYSVCHTGAQGFLLPEKPDEYNGLDVWENHSFDGGNRVTSLRISEALFEAGSEVIRVGFYIKNPLPTGHTQDLKYITYMRSVD